MAESRILTELNETKMELQRLRERMLAGTPTVHKDLSLISLVQKWSGSESTVTLEEFFSSIEAAARIGRWEDKDQVEIAILKLTDSAKLFYLGCAELHAKDVKWDTLKEVFRSRFRDVHTDQYHYMKLQTARQSKNESPQEFADRCRSLAQKIVCKVNDPTAQRIHQENAERMLLASFVTGLVGTPGRQVRYANPQTMDQALKIALSVQEAERQERFSESFYTQFDKSVRLTSEPANRTQRSADTRAVNHMRNQRYDSPSKADRAAIPSTRDARTKQAVKCFECNGIGHFARECPTRIKREENLSDRSRWRNPSRRSKRLGSPDRKPSRATRREAKREVNDSGNGVEV